MFRRRPRGGIERKFLTSILWVGVVPMLLSVLIGFVYVYEGQQVAVERELATAARKTSEGLQVALNTRLRLSARLTSDPDILTTLRKAQELRKTYDDFTHPVFLESYSRLQNILKEKSAASLDLEPGFKLYNSSGAFVIGTPPSEFQEPAQPTWPELVNQPRFHNFFYDTTEGRYVSQIVSPIQDPVTRERVGFLLEMQGAQDLLQFALGYGQSQKNTSSAAIESAVRYANFYELLYISDESNFLVYMEPVKDSYDAFRLHIDTQGSPQKINAPVTNYSTIDKKLLNILQKAEAPDYGTTRVWQYQTHNRVMPVLLAYHSLPSQNRDAKLYVVVYRPAWNVFSNLYIGAFVAMITAFLVIGVFCIIAYRNVHNNVIRPISLLNEGAQIIRQGDLELKLKIDTGDEIEELAHSFNKMALTLRDKLDELEASKERYRSLFSSMRDGIFQTDAEWNITLVNPAGADILGYKEANQLIGVCFKEFFVDPVEFERMQTRLRELIFTERTRLWMKKKGDMHPICVELMGNRVCDDCDVMVGMEGSFRDVTHNVRLEVEARERSEMISAINQIAKIINSSLEVGNVYESIVHELHKLINFDYAGVALLSADRQSIFMSRLFPERTRKEMDSDVDEVTLKYQGSFAELVVERQSSLIVDSLHTGLFTFSSYFPDEIDSCICVPLYAPDGIIGTLNIGSRQSYAFDRYAVEVLDQMAPHLAVAIRNTNLLENLQQSLDEVTEAREKLHAANEELKTLDEMKNNLLSNVSHELRTPLVSVMGYTDMIRKGKTGPINELQQEYLGIALRNVEKLVTLIENLLDFSRMHQGSEEIAFDRFDLIDCARTSIEIIKPISDSKKEEIILNCPVEKVIVDGDKGKIGQVFNNLLSNAVKFNDQGGKVTIDIIPGDDQVDVSVSDTGIGIPEEALDKIFTRFYQYDASSTRKYGGTGIGLSIAQDIMRQHGSRLTVTSKVDEGTTFRFRLPLSKFSREGDVVGIYELPLPIETQMLVELITEDRAMSAQTRNLLFSEGISLIQASDQKTASELALKHSPDCILFDVESELNPKKMTEDLLQNPVFEAIPIIIITNDEALYEQFSKRLAGRIKRGFRKSGLLSGIHYALSKGAPTGEQLGNKILCVDEDPAVANFMANCFKAEGFECVGCRSGKEAIERLLSGEYWFVFLDIALPDTDPWELCKTLKSDVNLAGIRVYMVISQITDRDKTRLSKAGADGYLAKPFQAEELAGLVQGQEWRQTGSKRDNTFNNFNI